MKQKTAGPEPMVQLLSVQKENVGEWAQAASVSLIEIPQAILEKHGHVIEKTEPDIFAVVIMHLTKKAREILKI